MCLHLRGVPRWPLGLLVASVLAACSPSPGPAPPDTGAPAPDGDVRVNGTEQVGWDQTIDDGRQAGDYRFGAYVDGTAADLAEVRCLSASARQLTCSAPLPPMQPGRRILQLVAWWPSGSGRVESQRSTPLTLLVGSGMTEAGRRDGNESAGEGVNRGAAGSVDTLVAGLDDPHHLTPLDDGRLLMIDGQSILAWSVAASSATPIDLEWPRDDAPARLLGLAAHPRFATTRRLYFAHSLDRGDGILVLRITTATELAGRAGQVQTLFEAAFSPETTAPPRLRMRFGPDGHLFVGIADPGTGVASRRFGRLEGAVLRLRDDGAVPEDNPYRSAIFSSGHGVLLAVDWAVGSARPWIMERRSNGEVWLEAAAGECAAAGLEGIASRAVQVPPRATGFATGPPKIGGDFVVAEGQSLRPLAPARAEPLARLPHGAGEVAEILPGRTPDELLLIVRDRQPRRASIARLLFR